MFNFFFVNHFSISDLLQKANLLYEQKKFAEAAELYRKILQKDAGHYAALANLAVSYFELGEYEKAAEKFLQVIKKDSTNPWWHNYLSQSWQKIGNLSEALKEGWLAVELSNGAKEHQLNLAYTVYEVSDEKGIAVVEPLLKKWYGRYPDDAVCKQCYKSFFHDKNFTRSEAEYVESLFDVFAPDFDEVLEELEYCSPKYVAEYLAEYILSGEVVGSCRILDLGCGSGLCGKYIKERMPDCEIYGVDISGNMLQEADKKGIYKQLLKSDISDCFDKYDVAFNIVVSADVFTYFGTLDSIFSAVHYILDSKGIFIFTITENTINEQDYFLTSASRFIHSENYITKLLKDSDFSTIKKEKICLRKEGDKNVFGYIIMAQKI